MFKSKKQGPTIHSRNHGNKVVSIVNGDWGAIITLRPGFFFGRAKKNSRTKKLKNLKESGNFLANGPKNKRETINIAKSRINH